VVLEMLVRPVDAVGDRRAARARAFIPRAEHQVLDDELRAAAEELGERHGPVGRVEHVLLLDRHPRERLALARERVVQARELLLALEQRGAGGAPLVSGSDAMRHGVLLGSGGPCVTTALHILR
jgi:hypothetical protein